MERIDYATDTILGQHDDGSSHNAEVLIGSASQLVSEDYETVGPEIEDEEVPADYDRTGRGGPGRSDSDEDSAGPVDPKTLTSDGSPVENPSG